MPDFPEAGVRLVAETGDANSAIDELAGNLDSLTSGSYLLTLETEVDTSGLDNADIPTEDDTVTTTVDVQETDTAKASLDALNFLKNTKVIETIWNIAGTAVNLFEQFGGQILQPMVDLDTAVANVNAQTGNAIPNARELIKNIFYDDLGESIEQVGKLVTQAHAIGAPVDEATRAALRFTHTFQDENPETVLNTMNQLVVNKLTPDFEKAGDVLVTAFQNGANRGHDLLQALNDNATAIHDMGLTGPQALSFIKTGLDNGFTSATQVLNLLEKIKQNVTNAAGNPTSDVSKTLKQLGIANPAETGEAWSADFFKAVIDKITNMPGLTDTQREAMFSTLAGGKQGGKTFSAFLQISPDDADTIFANVDGAAERAAHDADDSIKGVVDDFRLAVEKAVQDWLSSDAIDLPGKIKLLKIGLQNALDTLSKGGTLGDALTVALKPIGLDDEFQGLEKALGDVVIAVLQMVASIQDFTGHGEEAIGTRAVVVKLAENQLGFNLKIDNPEEIAMDISTAASRGLSDSDIEKEISGVIQGLVKMGTKESLDQAQAIINTLKTPVDQNKLPTLASGAPMNVEPVVSDEALDKLQGQINKGMESVPPPDKVDAFQQSVEALGLSTETVTVKAGDSLNPLKQQSDATQKVTNSANKIYPTLNDQASATAQVTVQADTASVSLLGVAGSLQVIADKAGAVSQAADNLAQKSNSGSGGAAESPNTSGPHAAGTDRVSGTFSVGEQGRELVTTNRDLAVLNNMTTEAIMAALSGYVAGGAAFGRGGGNSFTAINNNVVQSEAQADALGYSTAAQLRGMANQ